MILENVKQRPYVGKLRRPSQEAEEKKMSRWPIERLDLKNIKQWNFASEAGFLANLCLETPQIKIWVLLLTYLN